MPRKRIINLLERKIIKYRLFKELYQKNKAYHITATFLKD